MRNLLAALAVVASILPDGSSSAAVPEYDAIRAAQVSANAISVENLELERDVITFTFASGSFHFVQPEGGPPFAAVFVGDGSYSLKPATAGELRQLRLVTGNEKLGSLTDSFERLVLFFTDRTEAQLRAAGKDAPSPSTHAQAVDAFQQHMSLQKKEYQTNLQLRVLADLLNGHHGKSGLFFAAVDGKRYAPGLLLVDPMGIGNLAAEFGFMGGEEVGFLSSDPQNGGFWYASAFKNDAREGAGKPLIQTAEALHYRVSTTIGSRAAIEGETLIQVRALLPGIRVLPVQLLPKLRITSAALADGTKVEYVQEEVRLGAWKRLFQDEVADGDAALIFPEPLSTTEPTEVRITYEGTDVLQGIGESSYSVRARESWYPNLHAFLDTATYELIFRYPKSMSLVAVGRLESETVEQGQKKAVWKSDVPMRVAGFNYGKFEKRTRTDPPTGITVDVYTNRDWQKMAGDVMTDALNATRIATLFFGPPPHMNLSVTQQSEWFFGQSWPTLVYLPTLALTTQTERVFGFEGAGPQAISSLNEFAETVAWHEVAHQWWGHKIAWESYRDQWLSEGIAEFTAALALQFTRSLEHYFGFWDRRREDILGRRGSLPNKDAGAITQGWRLATRFNPAAAQTMLYYKGAYVLHMLRMMMAEPGAEQADARFTAMMRDFLASFDGRSPSTADFQKVVERHMVPTMNAAGNNRMDWFFDQWVRGTEIPKLSSDVRAEKSADGKYHLKGGVTQSGVSAGFITVVPLYAEFEGGSYGRIGMVRLIGSQTNAIDATVALPKPPKRIAINLMRDVLTVN